MMIAWIEIKIKRLCCAEVELNVELKLDFGEIIILVVTGGKQSQLLVLLTWTGLDLDWSLTIGSVT